MSNLIIDDELDYNKVINSVCFCGTGLPWKKDQVVMSFPCEHIYHKSCYDDIKNKTCPLCEKQIHKIFKMTDNDIHHQRFADLLSMSYYNDMMNTNPGTFLDSIFDLGSLLARVPFMQNRQNGREICEQLFSLNNLTMKVYGMNKIKLEKNKVFICNHVSMLEWAVLYYLFGTGFLVSSISEQSKLFNEIKKKSFIPILMVQRGTKHRKVDIIEEMRKFVDEKGSICIFPEGMVKHPDSLLRFRSGAFLVGRPIYAIVIRHIDVLADGYINSFIYKIGGKRNATIEVHVLGPYYPPFTETVIEEIRSDMAKVGNMVLSRVSNRDVKDVKGKKVDI